MFLTFKTMQAPKELKSSVKNEVYTVLWYKARERRNRRPRKTALKQEEGDNRFKSRTQSIKTGSKNTSWFDAHGVTIEVTATIWPLIKKSKRKFACKRNKNKSCFLASSERFQPHIALRVCLRVRGAKIGCWSFVAVLVLLLLSR